MGALQALGPDRAGALKAELVEVARRFDVSEDDTLATTWLHVTEDGAAAERLAAFAAAGVRRVFVWPLGDEVRQLERFREDVAALI